jgi:rod shape-determining protein MreD
MINQTQLLLLLKVTILAFILGSISLPNILELVSPFWLLLFFIYWLIYSDSNEIFSAALIIGLLLDVLQGAILGQNALALIVSSAFILNVKKSFFVSNLTTQQVYVFIASLIYLVLFLMTHLIVQDFQIQWLIILVPFTSALVWPVIRFFLAKLK